jgi:putative ABC transport system substrate-binding protein
VILDFRWFDVGHHRFWILDWGRADREKAKSSGSRQQKRHRDCMSKEVICLALCALLLALCVSAEAQQPKKIPRIGYLTVASLSSNLPRRDAFLEGLRNLGYVEGQNIIIEYRYADSMTERLSELAADLARLKVDVIVAGGTQVNVAAKKVTGTIPIVMANADDPVGSGLVESLARPGSNVTGLSSMSKELSGKRLELFREAFPKVRSLAVIWYTASNPAFRETEASAQTLGFRIRSLEVRGPADLDSAFALVTRERPDGFFPVTSAFMSANRKRVVEFATKNRLPALYSNREYVDDGGLMSYAANVHEMHRRAATYVDRILKGAKPADLPVEQPTEFELIINLKTAKQIGVTIPASVLAQADKVIK